MNPKTTLWLTVIALGLFGYIYFVDLRSGSSAAALSVTQKLLPDLEVTKVTGVEVTCSNQTIRAELTGARWHLANPPYPAQGAAIESFLDVLTRLNRQSEIPAHEII